MTPVFLFVENLAGLDIATHAPELASRRLVKFVTPGVMAFAEPRFREHGWVVTLSAATVRVLKPLLSLLQFPVIQQDPLGWAFRLGIWKQVLSDGLLTEFIVKHLGAPVRRFYSLTTIRGGSAKVVPGCAIVGSNWLEFGSMRPTCGIWRKVIREGCTIATPRSAARCLSGFLVQTTYAGQIDRLKHCCATKAFPNSS